MMQQWWTSFFIFTSFFCMILELVIALMQLNYWSRLTDLQRLFALRHTLGKKATEGCGNVAHISSLISVVIHLNQGHLLRLVLTEPTLALYTSSRKKNSWNGLKQILRKKPRKTNVEIVSLTRSCHIPERRRPSHCLVLLTYSVALLQLALARILLLWVYWECPSKTYLLSHYSYLSAARS